MSETPPLARLVDVAGGEPSACYLSSARYSVRQSSWETAMALRLGMTEQVFRVQGGLPTPRSKSGPSGCRTLVLQGDGEREQRGVTRSSTTLRIQDALHALSTRTFTLPVHQHNSRGHRHSQGGPWGHGV